MHSQNTAPTLDPGKLAQGDVYKGWVFLLHQLYTQR